MSFVDTHSHLDLPVFDEDREAVLHRAANAGVHAIVVIGFDPARWETSRSFAREHANVARVAGLHPNEAGQWSMALREGLEREVASGEVIAVGETGLDYFRDRASANRQREAFTAQLALARDVGLPVVIHQRSAEDGVIEILRPFAPVHGVMHCFSGDAAFASTCLGLGLHLGIGGAATYPKSETIRQAIAGVPLDRLILETDAPYLAPQRSRGKRNEPAFLIETAAVIAAARDEPIERVAEVTTEAALELFGSRLADALRRGQELG
jgi:TatD DNase family protein